METSEQTIESYREVLKKGGLDLLAKTVAAKVKPWLIEHDLPADETGDVFYTSWLEHFNYP